MAIGAFVPLVLFIVILTFFAPERYQRFIRERAPAA